jgi:hypothetical protein
VAPARRGGAREEAFQEKVRSRELVAMVYPEHIKENECNDDDADDEEEQTTTLATRHGGVPAAAHHGGVGGGRHHAGCGEARALL